MPLSEHEQKVLEQMEQALYAEDPRFATSLGKTEARAKRRRAGLGFLMALLGLGLVLLAVSMQQIWIGGFGFAAMVFGGGLAVTSPRHKGASLGAVDKDGKVVPHVGSGKSRSGKSTPKSQGLMDRFEQRWDKRREQGPS